jgi:CheY-like chemotaxis protein
MAEKETEHKKKILIIDDEVVNRTVLEDDLSGFGYEVFTAGNGTEGLEMLEKAAPDLILLDINMPGKDGFQTREEIKRHPKCSSVPVLFLSSFDRSNLKVKGLELGAEDYITRPFDKAELLARIRAALRRAEPCGKKVEQDRIMAGSLSDMGLVELLQPLEMAGKVATVKLKDLDAEVVLENGLLVFIRQGRFTGGDALNRILLGEKGDFLVTFNKIPGNIDKQPVKLMKAIMDSIAYIDEVKSMIARLAARSGPGQPGIVITPGTRKLKGAENFRDQTLMPLIYFIISLEGDLKEIVSSLLTMLENDRLILKPVSDTMQSVDNK